MGFRTTGVYSMTEASKVLRERAVDCITLDLSLGEQSGMDILQKSAL